MKRLKVSRPQGFQGPHRPPTLNRERKQGPFHAFPREEKPPRSFVSRPDTQVSRTRVPFPKEAPLQMFGTLHKQLGGGSLDCREGEKGGLPPLQNLLGRMGLAVQPFGKPPAHSPAPARTHLAPPARGPRLSHAGEGRETLAAAAGFF